MDEALVVLGISTLLVTMVLLARAAMRSRPGKPVDRAAAAHDAEPERQPEVTGLRLEIDLVYAKLGEEAEARRVTIRDAWGHFGPRGGFELHSKIRGHCHLRQGERTFHVLGVRKLTDVASGEAVTGVRDVERWLSRKIGAEVRAGRGRRAR